MSRTQAIMNPLPFPRQQFKRQEPRLRALLELALDNGATVRDGRHYLFRMPSGRCFTVPKSPSDYRGMLNNMMSIRRILREEGLLE